MAVVTESSRDVYFGERTNALGRLVNRDLRIIGVVADAPLQHVPGRSVAGHVPAVHSGAPAAGDDLHRSRPPAIEGQAISDVSAVIRSYDPMLKVTATPMAKLVDAAMGRERFAACGGCRRWRCSRWCCPARASMPTVALRGLGAPDRLAVRTGARCHATRRTATSSSAARFVWRLVGICLGVPCAVCPDEGDF